jgi:protease-4
MGHKKYWLFALVIFAILVILFLGFLAWATWRIQRPPTIEDNSTIEISLSGSIREFPSPNPFVSLFNPDHQLTIYDIWQIFDYGRKDPRISAIYLEIAPLTFQWAQVEEIRDAIKSFRSSGKKVHVFLAGDVSEELEFYLASAADTITLNPNSTLLLNGLLSETFFFKKALENLEIQPDFIQFKEFKSPEIFEREKFSPQIRSMRSSILEDMQARFLQTVSSERSISSAVINDILEFGLINGTTAFESGLVDLAGYRNDLLLQIAKETNLDIFEGISSQDYLKSARKRFQEHGTRVALVGGTGPIISGKGEPFTETMSGVNISKTLNRIRHSGDYEAVLFRVNSPGGSVVGSDMIWREIQLLEQSGIPVIVSMSGVAGSGGYYISMAASKIISQPSTITGSIGVIFGKFNVQGLFTRFGISTDRVKTAPNADLFSSFNSLTSGQKKYLNSWIEGIYNSFVAKAAKGRQMEVSQLEAKARGKIYTGYQAKKIGLVDELGGFSKALESIRMELQLSPDAPITLVQFPKIKGFLESLSGIYNLQVYRSAKSTFRIRKALEELDEGPGVRLLMPEIKIH